jgi:acrylyl-CoA reductase (NADPH)
VGCLKHRNAIKERVVMKFRALWVTEDSSKERYNKRVVERQLSDLPEGDVLIKVAYSSLNYKDALSAHGNKGVTKQFPHVPGIDASGVVASSRVPEFVEGDKVIVTGYDLGMNTLGGFSEYIRVPAHWVVKLPNGFDLKEAMAWGTAGLTAAISVDSLLQVGIQPNQGEVLVTGATGGVGSITCMILSRLGFDVVAGTGKMNTAEFFKSLGVTKIISRESLQVDVDKPMLKERWVAAVDTVGGDILFNILKSTKYGGSVTCCGLVASPYFQASVFPFILRGINLMGIESAELPLEIKNYMWETIADEWRSENIWKINTEVTLDELPEKIDEIFNGQMLGHTLVKLSDL